MTIIVVAKIVTALLGVMFNFAGAYFFGIPGIVFAGGFCFLFYLPCGLQ